MLEAHAYGLASGKFSRDSRALARASLPRKFGESKSSFHFNINNPIVGDTF